MFFSYNKNQILFPVLISIILIGVQGFLPSIDLSDGFIITCDLFLIYLTWLALNKKLYQVIIFAFFFGLLQDLIIQPETVGLYAFIKVISVYFINYLIKVKNLWSLTACFFYLYGIYFLHYFIYHYVFVNDLSMILLIYVIIESFLNLFIFII